MARAAIVAVAAVLVGALSTSAAGAEKVYYETPFGQVVYKPKRIGFSDLTLTRIHWRFWNSRRALGAARGHGSTRATRAARPGTSSTAPPSCGCSSVTGRTVGSSTAA
jgi:hypothetical protein